MLHGQFNLLNPRTGVIIEVNIKVKLTVNLGTRERHSPWGQGSM
jgi:hypothetical protein